MLSYASIEVRGGWPNLPKNAKLAPGSIGPDVALLRQRLALTGDLDPRGRRARPMTRRSSPR